MNINENINSKEAFVIKNLKVEYTETPLGLEKPITNVNIPPELINNNNKYDAHDICLWCNFGLFTKYIDGTEDRNKITGSSNPHARPWEDV